MECQQCREILSAVLDGEASTAESEQAGRHLCGCRDCRDWVAQAEAVTRRVGIGPVGGDLSGLVDRVFAAGEHSWSPREPETAEWLEPARSPAGPERPLRLVSQNQAPAGSVCGCVASCRCGCQQGHACRCGPLAG